jgi:hypothetical protein
MAATIFRELRAELQQVMTSQKRRLEQPGLMSIGSEFSDRYLPATMRVVQLWLSQCEPFQDAGKAADLVAGVQDRVRG